MSQIQITGEAKIRDLQGPVVANSGVITALDGLPSQYVRGDGTLADIPSVTGGGSSVSYYLNGSVNQGTFAGSTYYQMSKDAITGVGTNFSASTDGLLAQFITDANDPDVSSIPSGNWNIEFYMGVSASSGALASFYVEFYKWNGSAFTFLASNVATPEFLTNTTTVDAYFTSVAFPETPLATTDRLAIRVYANVASKTVTMYTEDNRLCQIVTTFSKGLLSMNSLTDQEQYLTVGTAGTDFNIASSLDTHTFNIPVASATNTGKLSSTDWTTFNNKVPYTGATGPVNLGAYDLTVNGLTIGKGGGGFASNTAIGLNVLASNAGINNLGVGGLALFSNTIGVQNAALGVVSLYSNTSGSYNSSVGYQSLYSNTTGTSNNALGSGSLYSNTTGANNVAIGNAALFGNVSGDGNTSIGVSSLQNSTGVRNTAIGYDAGNLIMTGSYNTIIGSYTGTSSMSSNVILADGQGNIRYRFDGTNNNFYQDVNLGENTYTGGFVQANGTSVLSGTISLKQNGFIPATTGYATIGSVSAGKLSIYFGESGLKSVELQNDLLTASRTYDFPDLSGTIALLEGSQTFSGSKSFTAFASFSGPTTKLGNGLYFDKGGLPSALTTTTTNLYSESGNNNIVSQDNNNKSKLQFQGSSDYTYTFPASSGTVALTGDLSAYVTLSTAQTISGNKTFSGTSLFTGTGTFNSSLQAAVGIIFPTSGVVSNGAGIVGLGAYSGGLRTAFNGGYTSDLAFQMGANYVYTFPASSGTLALTSNIPSVSGTSGQVTYFNGTSSVTGSSNHFWDATNNRLGIGLTNPQRSLEIYSATADSHLRLSGSAPSVSMGEAVTGSVYQAKFGLATASGQYVSGAVAGDFIMLSQTGATIFATSATEKARITSGGNLLVGTTSDNGSKLQVNGNATFSSNIQLTGTANSFQVASIFRNANRVFFGGDTGGYFFQNSGNTATILQIADSGAATFSSSVTALSANGSPATSGTTQTASLRLAYSNGVGLDFGAYSSSPFGTWIQAVDRTALGSTYPLILNPNGGNVGIGTSSPNFTASGRTTLDINGSASSGIGMSSGGTLNGYIYSNSSAMLMGATGTVPLTFETNGSERMRITSLGGVLIGKTAEDATTRGTFFRQNSWSSFSNNGDTVVIMNRNTSNGVILELSYAGSVVGTISTNANSLPSDLNFKKDIADISLGLNLVTKLRPVHYRHKMDNDNEALSNGIIAQELEQSLLECGVEKNSLLMLQHKPNEKENESQYWVDYTKMIPILIKSIQEQQAQIEELSNKIVALESK